ncbi:putative LRR receptor-like serine/threonine-protein kinase [Abeliophyllum distichum]|uniref:LRR receptor-like serine/threonine-protein kinase n=1 Tax=Abeliophyllum distichum TaxID=126358 RepID=A0ABD1V759_9LAMI
MGRSARLGSFDLQASGPNRASFLGTIGLLIPRRVELGSPLWTSRAHADTQDEIQALNAFKLSLHDPLGALTGWEPSTPSAPCDWRGVSRYNGRVSELRLPRLHLSGALSPQVANLRMLRKLSLHSNSLNGTIPTSLSKCTLLNSIFLQYNSFSGTLYSVVSNLTNLLVLNVAGNYLSGEIPGDLPKNLRFIDLSSNSFSGDIPKNVSSGSQLLQLINLSYNRISEEH